MFDICVNFDVGMVFYSFYFLLNDEFLEIFVEIKDLL